MARLRSKKGCPWDRAQTHDSIKKHLIEEAYEVCEAMDSGSPQKLRDELGDLLFQVIFHAQMAKERGLFDIDGVLRTSYEKMIRRHPHVFGTHKASGPEEAYKRWQEKKDKEGAGDNNLLSGIPAPLPALLKAYKVSRRAALAGFNWPDIKDAVKKAEEELKETKKVLKHKDKSGIREEIGDLLFAIINVARFAEIDPEDALNRTTKKFATRFKKMESALKRQGRKIEDCALKELKSLWDLHK